MKKKFLFSPRLLISAMILAAGIFASAQSLSESRTRKESFGVTTETTLEVENKYGTILIVPWKKDSVQLTADIYLEAKNSSKLRKLKNDIRISFSSTKNYIVARTVIGDGSSRVASELRTLSNTLGNSSGVQINYTIYLPEYVNLVLTNKYGDIYIDDINGDVDISLSNGVLKANTFMGKSNLELVFAKGSIRQLGSSSLKMAYADLDLGSVEQLDFSGKSSELNIEKAGVVKIDSRRDKIKLGELEYLFGNSSFTDVVIRDFIREADCSMKYGTIKFESIQADFSRIFLHSDYTDISLYFPPDCSYNLDILHNDKAIVNLPRKKAKLETSRTGDETITIEGLVGDSKTDRKLNIQADHKCYINISTR